MTGTTYPQSMRAIAAEIDGEVVGVAGVLHSFPLQAFSQIKPGALVGRNHILKEGREMFRQILDSYDAYIVALPGKESTARRFLKWVGFNEREEGFFEWMPSHRRP